MLDVKSITVRYDTIAALTDMSLHAAAGEVTTVIGSNGAGKSTLLRAISGLIRTEAGEIRLLGDRIDNLAPAEVVRRGVCQVPEGRELFARMSVYDNLMAGAYLRRDKTAIRRDLDKTYDYFPVLAKKARNAARDLSGGEQQMLAFGRAIMAAPKVLLLDEPSVGLAPLIEKSLMATVAALAKNENVAVVLVEQNANLALSVAREGYVLNLGRLVTRNSASALLSDPAVRQAYLGL
jgi:branched-chain amino acid transport system ATP-binding protein